MDTRKVLVSPGSRRWTRPCVRSKVRRFGKFVLGSSPTTYPSRGSARSFQMTNHGSVERSKRTRTPASPPAPSRSAAPYPSASPRGTHRNTSSGRPATGATHAAYSRIPAAAPPVYGAISSAATWIRAPSPTSGVPKLRWYSSWSSAVRPPRFSTSSSMASVPVPGTCS